MRAYTACLFAAFALGVPESARAWTDARVVSVEAQVDVRDPEVAHVELWLRVHVRQGVLSMVTFDGLDPDFQLTELVAPPGAALPLVTQNGRGQLELRWPDAKDAPKLGEHLVRLVYATSQLYADARAKGTRRVAWTLPRWPDRLSNVHVTVIGPAGLMPLQEEPNLGEQIESVPKEAPRMLTFTRIELPRLTPYEIQFEVPQLSTSAADSDAIGGWTSAAVVRTAGRELPSLLVGLCFAALVVGKRRVRRKRLVARRMLLPALERKAFDRALFVAAALAPMLIGRAPAIAFAAAFLAVASALEESRPKRRLTPAADGGGQEREAEAQPDWLSARAALDATTPAGIACLAALLSAASLAPEPLRSTALICGWLATPLFFSGTRLSARDV